MSDEVFSTPFPAQLLPFASPIVQKALIAMWPHLTNAQRQYFATEQPGLELKLELERAISQRLSEEPSLLNAEGQRLQEERMAAEDVLVEQLKTSFALSAWSANTHGVHIESYLLVIRNGQCARLAARLFGTYVQWVAVLADSIHAREGIELRVPETNLPVGDWKDLPVDEVCIVKFLVSDDDTAVLVNN